MNKKYNNISDVSTNNLYKMLDDVKYQDADNQAMIKSEISFRQCNELKAWQNGSLVNKEALKKLSLKELSKLNDMLSKAGY
tara:strand:- start:434 stop:676 length:243 start_codon:yes stop_codon:yes gene_type:complete